MFKLNFDGAAKGNMGPTGFGGSIRNVEGEIMGVCWGYIGENTNNVDELKGLQAGLNLVVNQGWLSIILEGDSQIILRMVSKLLHGKPMSKVVDNWKMAHTLEQVQDLLRVHSEAQIYINHIRVVGAMGDSL